MKKEYTKPSVEWVSFRANEDLAGPTGSMGITDRPTSAGYNEDDSSYSFK